ncbi:hypothetical protein CS053_08685 [Rhodanobacter glycinis]|uniref:Uncharacterized protein n=1 Tax=Rhodanobacter glycinis TaxID=582702 RepID=A0A5B9DX14_9GAMM|nr:hypothetical protein [Rhodanobacter glycinis]QEE24572.1 hypothetical protein CS053_08685 [Rhodanobacter glycinis]
MSTVAERKAESIALMLGKTAYRDLRNGFSTVTRIDDSDMTIKAALGAAQRRAGIIPVKAMETKYASTLMHERLLRRAYDAASQKPEDPTFYAVRRMAVSIAIRQHAGLKIGRDEMTEYAWILHVRRETLDGALHRAGSWLEEITFTALAHFTKALREPLVDGTKKRA